MHCPGRADILPRADLPRRAGDSREHVHGEEVAGQHLAGVLLNELAPGPLAATRGGLKAVTAEDSAYGLVGAAMAQLSQLADDPAIAPTFLLLGQLQDEVVKLAAGNGPTPTRPTPKRVPLAAYQLSVPAQQRLWAGQRDSPSWLGQNPADRCQHKTVGRLPAWPADLTLQHPKLIAKCQHLSAEPGIVLAPHDRELDQAAEQVVEKAVEHDRASIAGRGWAPGWRL